MMGRGSYLMVWMVLLIPAVSAANEDITAEDVGQEVVFTCKDGKWKIENGTEILSESEMRLPYEDANSNEYTCMKNENPIKIFVKFRTCENCIELDPSTVSGILVGDLVATVLIGVAVYFIASQPKGKQVYRGSKASDRQNLIQNQQNDTYQPLTQGHSSEYSQLEKRKR